MILGDGSYVVTLEKRGYVKAGDWTPEASVEVSCPQLEVSLSKPRSRME